MTECYVTYQVNIFCDEPKPLVCLKCGSEEVAIDENPIYDTLICDMCGAFHWKDERGLHLVDE